MKKFRLLPLIIFMVVSTACGSASRTTAPMTGAQSGPAGELSLPIQIAIGTVKLDGTGNAITKVQAAELLPLWETLQVLENSDTAASEEKEALLSQIQETMTGDQMQAITALSLTRQDMFALMQSQGGLPSVGSQNSNGQSSSSSSNSGRAFNPGGDFPGGPPPDGGFPGGGRSSQSSSSTQSTGSSQDRNQQVINDPNRIPTPLVQAIIEYLKTKAGS